MIAYGSKVQLVHNAEWRLLRAGELTYHHEGGSGQHEVYAAMHGPEGSDVWVVLGPHGADDRSGPVSHLDRVRLRNARTGRCLHSHRNRPALAKEHHQEVSTFAEADTNDNWVLELDGASRWDLLARFKLVHENTNAALHSHVEQLRVGQFEVTGFAGRNGDDWWHARVVGGDSPAASSNLPPAWMFVLGFILAMTVVLAGTIVGIVAIIANS